MIKLESRVVNFIHRHIVWFGFGGLLVLSVVLRYALLPFQSSDYKVFLEQWYLLFRAYGGYQALRIPEGDYNYLYRFLLALASYFPQATVSIKMISLVFDYIGAAAGGYLVYLLSLSQGAAHTKARLLGLFGAAGLLFTPTVLMNASMWAQCDFTYTAFLFLCIACLLKDKYTAAFIFYGVAFSFKLQAVFLLPALLIWYLYRRKFSILQFLWVPATMIITSMPVIFLHLIDGMGLRSFWMPFRIYVSQVGSAGMLTYNMPNLYAFFRNNGAEVTANFSLYGIPDGYNYFKAAGILLTVIILAIMTVLILAKSWQLDAEGFILLCIFSLSTCVMFLPAMHERYCFAATLLMLLYAVAFRKMAALALAALAIESVMALPFLMGADLPCDLRWLALGNLIIYFCFTLHSLRHFSTTKKPFAAQ